MAEKSPPLTDAQKRELESDQASRVAARQGAGQQAMIDQRATEAAAAAERVRLAAALNTQPARVTTNVLRPDLELQGVAPETNAAGSKRTDYHPREE